jgi:hypothetical protein
LVLYEHRNATGVVAAVREMFPHGYPELIAAITHERWQSIVVYQESDDMSPLLMMFFVEEAGHCGLRFVAVSTASAKPTQKAAEQFALAMFQHIETNTPRT